MSNEHDESQGMISTLSERLLNGLFKENPTFVLLLGMCPTLAVTTSAINGLGMGVTTMVVLAMSNLIISALRNIIPNKVRIPAFIVIIASFVTIVELLLKAYISSLYDALGIYIPLIVVNCIILGRAESYAYSHPVLPSLFDGIGMGMGFSVALTIIGGIREILGSGKFFGMMIMPEGFIPISIFVMAPGAFFVLALLTAIQNVVKDIGTKKGLDMSKIQSGCGGNCMDCNKDCKGGGLLPANTGVSAEKNKPVKENKTKTEDKADAAASDKASQDEADKDETVKKENKLISMMGKLKAKLPAKTEDKDSSEEETSDKADKEDKPSEKEDKAASQKKPEKKEKKADSSKKQDQDTEPERKVESEEKTVTAPEAMPDTVTEKDKEKKPAEESVSEKEKSDAEAAPAMAETPADTEPAKAEDTVKTEPAKAEAPTKKESVMAEPVKPEQKDVYKVDEASLAPDEDDELEIIDLSTLKSQSPKNLPSGKRTGKKTSAKEKAKAMLFKAEESVKEDGND